MSDNSNQVPIIDFDRIGLHRKADDISNEVLSDIGQEMKKALQKFGFVYAKNYGISFERISGVRASAKEFFEQPEELKKPHTFEPKSERGWVRLGCECSDPAGNLSDFKESFNYHPLDNRNDVLLTSFKNQNKEMYKLCHQLLFRVTDALANAFGYEVSLLRGSYEGIGEKESQTFLRNLHYPAVPPHFEIQPGQVRLGAHTDYGIITFLFQDDVGGLEMNSPDVGYIPVTPIPGTVVIFIGVQMQRMLADALIATEHRIVMPESEEEARKCRQSLAFLVRADDNFVVKCLDGSTKYDPISSIKYLDQRQTEVRREHKED